MRQRLLTVFVFVVATVTTALAQPASQSPPPTITQRPPELYEDMSVDPRRGVIQMGGSVTGSGNWIHGAYVLEGGVTIPKLLPSPYYVRARALLSLVGGTMQSDWGGAYSRFGAGGELGGCTSFVCGFFDLDLAYQHATLYDDFQDLQGDRSGPHIYGRGGLDLGSGRFHFRGAIEVGRWKTHHSPSEWMKTGGILLAIGVRI